MIRNRSPNHAFKISVFKGIGLSDDANEQSILKAKAQLQNSTLASKRSKTLLPDEILSVSVVKSRVHAKDFILRV